MTVIDKRACQYILSRMEITHPRERTVKAFTYGGYAVAGLAMAACIATAPYMIGRVNAHKEALESGRPPAEVSELWGEKRDAVAIEVGLGALGIVSGAMIGFVQGFRRPEDPVELAATIVPKYS